MIRTLSLALSFGLSALHAGAAGYGVNLIVDGDPDHNGGIYSVNRDPVYVPVLGLRGEEHFALPDPLIGFQMNWQIHVSSGRLGLTCAWSAR
jgi:hypothetical protein